MNSFVSPDNIWGVWACVLLIVLAAFYLEEKYPWARKISGCVICLLGAMALSNLHILPMESPVYDMIWDYVIPLSIPMLLFRCDMKTIFQESGRLILLFLFSACGTIVGAILSYHFMKDLIPYLREITAMMTGSYIGGSVNLVALSSLFSIPGEWISATTVADNFMMAVYFILLISIPKLGFFQRHFSYLKERAVEEVIREDTVSPFQAIDIAKSLATAVTIVAISHLLSQYFAQTIPTDTVFFSILNQILGNLFLILTTLTMILATLFPSYFSNIHYADEMGNFLIYIFFVAIGVPASIFLILKNAPLLFVFCALMVGSNMLFTFGAGKIFHFTVEESIIVSNAAIGGPATSSGMAISQGWDSLVGPAIFIGLLGYVVGNYCGTLMGNILLV